MMEATRSGSDKRQRTHSATARFTPDEFAELTRRADAVGLTVASYMRLQAIDAAPPRAARTPPIDRRLTAQMLGQLGKIGSNINQIARAFNSAGNLPPPDELADAMAAVLELRAACLKAMGRRP